MSYINNRFNDMVYSILEDHGTELINDREYSELSDEYDQKFNEIKILLGKENKEILDELEEIRNSMSAIHEKLIYERGLQDGVELRTILKIAR